MMSNSSLSGFISNIISSSLGKASTVVFGLFCMLIYARWMAPEDYGGFVLLQVLIKLGLTFGEFGIDTATTRFIASTEDVVERRKIVNSGLYFRALCMIVISLIVFLFQDNLYKILGGIIPKILLIYLPFMLLIEGLHAFYTRVLEGMLKFKILAIVSFVYGLSSLILTIVLVIPFNMGAHGLVWARLVPELLSLILSIAATRTKLLLEFDWNYFKKMFQFGIPLYGNNLLAFAYSRADTILISYFFGSVEVAIYEFARRIPESLEILYGSFKDVYFPYISKLYAGGFKQKVAETINHANRLTSFLGGLGVLLAYGFGEWFFLLVFSEKYLSSVPSFNILMVVLVFIALDSNLGYSLVAIGEPEKPLYINIFRFGVVFICYFLLIPRLNIVGAVLSSLIGLAIVNPINLFFIKRRLEQVRLDVYLKPLLLLAAGCSLYYLVSSNVLISLISIVVFIGGSYFLGTLRLADINIFRQEALKIQSRLTTRKSEH